MRLPSAESTCEPEEDRQEREEHDGQDEEHQQRDERHEHDDRLDEEQVHERRVRVLVGELDVSLLCDRN